MARTPQSERWTVVKNYVCAGTIVVLCAGIASGLLFGTRRLESRAAAVVDKGGMVIDINWPLAREGTGTWLPQSCREQLSKLAGEAAGSSREVLTSEQLERIGAAMEQSGWYKDTPRVSRLAGGGIRVDGAWRIPAANVLYKGETFLISWDGGPMPAGVSATWTILNPAVGPPRDASGDRVYSQPWSGEDMAASLELLAKAAAEPWSSQVRAIDASHYADGGGLVIVTDRDTRVVWGGRPSKPRLGEVTTSQKLEHLRQLLHDTKRIDAGYPLIYVNQERMQFDISASTQEQQQARADVEEDAH